ncbi:gamma-glutamyltranspeptidase [Cokeromyces recurvatus]|uniref:gamma-glutamyltranspeptidase n=1 Tax=Cokeromyces recurvatus TaxID=90255 RepID=UPI00221E699B|nr:gamma-glutamyltranspeptidase [Cokeromyces recurvatus]KAI7897460.1 gamma-glutamyltranspeptidase [Cokeromyces recurvatus]
MTINNNKDLPFISRRSTVYGTHAMVASSQPLATQAGIDILKKGGNAADAAVAIAAVLNVTEPGSTGIGGDAFCLFFDAKTGTVKGLNGSGSTPAALTLDYLRHHENIIGASLATHSIHAITVPGAAAAWVDTIEHFGSGKLDLTTLLTPAIDLAENGFPVSHISAHSWEKETDNLKAVNKNNEWLIDNIRAPKEGEMMTIPTLAKTFRKLATEGKKGFYQGEIGDRILKALQERGSLMTAEDLAQHTSELIEPISIDYHDWTVWEIPPNGQGITTLMALGIIEQLEELGLIDFSRIPQGSADHLHIVTEALRIAFADTRCWLGDPDKVQVPTKELLSKEYLRKRATELFNIKERNAKIERGDVLAGNTVYFSVVDEEGNACSFINSLFMHFGSHVAVEDTGIVLHNRGCNFVLIEDHPNCLGPHKRPYHTIIPSMITCGDRLEACFGVMGAFMQPQGQVQVILNLKHYANNPQHALDLPRLCVAPPPLPPTTTKENDDDDDDDISSNAYHFTKVTDSVIYLEDGISEECQRELETRGHTCYRLYHHDRAMFGRGQIIKVNLDPRTGHRVLAAGSDPRGDGCAFGW